MAKLSNPEKYGNIAVSVHWLTAVFVVLALTLGFMGAEGMNDAGSKIPAERISLMRLHVIFGSLALALFILRIIWWTFFDKKPARVPGTPTWQRGFAVSVHFLLYAITMTTAALGITMLAKAGVFASLFLGSATPLPDFWEYAVRLPHGLLARLVILFVLFHIIGALVKLFTKGFSFLGRMWF